MILECLKCHKEFETENRYKSYCYECGKPKAQKDRGVVMKTVIICKCQHCGKEFEPTKRQLCRHVCSCPECIKNKSWYRS